VPSLLTTETRILVVCMFLGLTGWYPVQDVTDSTAVEFGVLIGVGVVVPTLINEWRRRNESTVAGSSYASMPSRAPAQPVPAVRPL